MDQRSRDTRASLETYIASLQRHIAEIEAEDSSSTNSSDEQCLKMIKIRFLNELIRRARAELDALTD